MELPNKVMRFLWNILPKLQEIVHGKPITYVRLPSFLLGNSQGMVLYHKNSSKIMVFTAICNPFRRYSVYHEYREGEILKRNKTTDQIFEVVSKKFQLILEVLGIPEYSNVDVPALREWVKQQGAHSEAILDEIELAKEELSPEKLALFYQDIKQRRRFG